MKITSIDYSIGTASLDIYVSGCNPPHCKNCHNEELWDFNAGNDYDTNIDQYIIRKCNIFDEMIDKILIMGGEILHQNQDDAVNLLKVCHDTDKKVYLFTRHDLVDVPEHFLPYLDYIKTGRYDETQLGEVKYYGITLASINQKIYKVKDII